MLKNKRIFITGGAGFIGSLLAKILCDENKILIYDSFSRNALQFRNLADHKNIYIFQGDILDEKNLEDALSNFKPTHIVHCAAIAGINTVIASPTSTLRINILGTAYLLELIKKLNLDVERVVLFSTSEIFGQQAFQSSESHSAIIGPVGEARWTYAVSKLADEHFGLAYHKEFKIPCTIVRPFNVYGPGQVGEGALSIFIQRALRNQTISIHSDGTQIRTWCYVDDMIDGLIKCMINPQAIGEAFNIGNVRAVTTIYGLASSVCRILGSKSPIEFSNKKIADVELRIPDVSKAKEILGFEAKVDLEEGIPLTAEYYKSISLPEAREA
ncbi:MAG: NAD-dependent epimerase/dehydratase family protein [Alphaproteobacteria bacterium]|nr:NAD-dependent epimerase/dehydratase family protein [Alphaproteobacteria bacterium]